MDNRKIRDAETRTVLLAAARSLIAEDPEFSLKTLLERSGVSRARFRRCFADKAGLLAALTGQDVAALGGILEQAQPESLKLAVGSDFAPAPMVQNDAWLERRLRVFERALAALEKRQEKSEQSFAQQLALFEEKLGGLSGTLTIVPAADTPAPQAETQSLVQPASAEIAAAEPASEEPGIQLALDMDVELEPAISEKEMADFLAHARKLAQAAANAPEPLPPQRLKNLRWLAWSGAVLLSLMLTAVLLLAGLALHAEPAEASAGVIHRHVAQSGMARTMALADSGDARAQTVLALAYLRGQGVASDEAAAKRWSQAAAAQGQPMAEYLLGTLYLQRDESEAARWFRAAAVQGNIKAMHNLAIAYAEGNGVEKDPVMAVNWFIRAASQGYRDSQFDMGVLYERGLGVPQSAQAALKWYLVAAAQGDAPSAARAAVLKEQMEAADAARAEEDSRRFVPLPVAGAANALPSL